ncbi:hypothetical protein Lfu02_40000 [Longispora fulva]|uniref:SUKH-4 immunity protein of toxin-antitoxin system n=1 Tax=Longispora fulva TaxID=619741 RepID=A0A8J7GF62_9ACTN|nr:SUKH-4 family immunity protein [Longispora fulva]MBG6136460.1 hypothetical protein [Longispora fulva]GIG59628.1 hypothetical protein Lfu02_40000 [Longispora fulva]
MSLEHENWPTFRLTVFDTVPTTVPATLPLFTTGVAHDMFDTVYQVTDRAAVKVVSGRPLVHFGNTGSALMCLDIESGHVVEVGSGGGGPVRLVNSSIGQFNASVQLVVERFPYYEADSELETREAIGEALRAQLMQVDSSSMSEDGFWETFVDDLIVGDYSNEDVLSS